VDWREPKEPQFVLKRVEAPPRRPRCWDCDLPALSCAKCQARMAENRQRDALRSQREKAGW
jgi:hypothetical protein